MNVNLRYPKTPRRNQKQLQQPKVKLIPGYHSLGPYSPKCSEIEEQLDHIRDVITEHEAHIEALEDGRPFVRTLTGKAKKKGKGSGNRQSSVGQKRKRGHNGDRPQKRRRSGSDDDDDDFIDDGSDDSASENGEGASSSDGSDGSGSDSESDDDDDEENEEEEEATIDGVKAKIQEAKEAIKEARSQLNEFRRLKKEANDTLATLKKRESKAQREKNAFCSAKRSEVCRLSVLLPLRFMN